MTSNPSRLSPGQSLTRKFPIVGEREPSPFTLDDWRLSVDGLVRRPLSFSLADLIALPTVDRAWDTMCVTGWTRLDLRWRGVLLDTVLAMAEALPEARFARFAAYSKRGHDTSLPLDEARQRVLLAYECDGQPLTAAHGGPVRSVTEGKYFYKSLKWLRQIELLADDQLGFWERTSAYHNQADPWLEQRYDPLPVSTDEFQRRLAARDFREVLAIMDPQFRALHGVDLSGARFEGARIKACDMSGVILRGANLQNANLTRTKLVDADLRGANLSGCDLEGADLRGADLREADLRQTSLTVAQFFHRHRPAIIAGARFLLSDVQNEGLDQRERQFLLDPRQKAIVE
ncbi:MAG: molybdopterin-dependent oxidoreductase [Chloroflexi bacterium]|nr:molybdopterin-dependent oxidoreductase [Chloroflexota bacterium]